MHRYRKDSCKSATKEHHHGLPARWKSLAQPAGWEDASAASLSMQGWKKNILKSQNLWNQWPQAFKYSILKHISIDKSCLKYMDLSEHIVLMHPLVYHRFPQWNCNHWSSDMHHFHPFSNKPICVMLKTWDLYRLVGYGPTIIRDSKHIGYH